MIPQGGVEFVGDRLRCTCHVGGETKDELVAFVKVRARVELGEVVKLRLGDALFSADGRVDVDSKRTANHHGDFELREFLQARRNGRLGKRRKDPCVRYSGKVWDRERGRACPEARDRDGVL